MSTDGKELTERFYVCMRAGASHVEELIGLFAEDAEYTEPFGPAGPRTHRGRDAIAQVLRAGTAQRPDDFVLELGRIEVGPDEVRATWTCASAAFGGAVPGTDRFVFDRGRIVRLVTTFDGPPRPAQSST